jgi:hypothetical protein
MPFAPGIARFVAARWNFLRGWRKVQWSVELLGAQALEKPQAV